MMFASVFVTFVNLFANVFYVLLFVRVIMSYFASPHNRFFGWIVGVTEPVLAPVRRVLPGVPGIDFSPLVAFILLQLLQSSVVWLLGA